MNCCVHVRLVLDYVVYHTFLSLHLLLFLIGAVNTREELFVIKRLKCRVIVQVTSCILSESISVSVDTLIELIRGYSHILWIVNVYRRAIHASKVTPQLFVFPCTSDHPTLKLLIDRRLIKGKDLGPRFIGVFFSEIVSGIYLLELFTLESLLDKLEFPVVQAFILREKVRFGPWVHLLRLLK